MADVAVVRKRVHSAIEQARRDQADRRGRVAEAQKNYDTFPQTAAIPAFRMIANVLKSEGLNFEVMTPAGGVRLQSERNREDAIEMELDTSADPPQPLVTITRVRGSRVVQSDRSIKGSNPLVQLTEDDVIEMLLEELRPWLSLTAAESSASLYHLLQSAVPRSPLRRSQSPRAPRRCAVRAPAAACGPTLRFPTA